MTSIVSRAFRLPSTLHTRTFGGGATWSAVRAVVWSFVLISGCSPRISIEETMEEAQLALRRHDHPTAQRLLEEVMKREPENHLARLYRAQLARDMGDDESATVLLAKIPDRAEKLAGSARFIEGSISLAAHQARAAEANLRRSLELNPENIVAQERLLQLAVLQRQKTKILNQIQEISLLRGLTLAELVLQLTAGERILAPKEAIEQLEAFVKSDPEDLICKSALAISENEDDDPQAAISLLRQIIEQHPDHQMARGLLAEMLVDQQELGAAQAVLQSVVLNEKSAMELWRGAGQFLLAAEEWERAAECFRFLAAGDALDRNAFRRLGLALQRSGKPLLAEIALQRAVKLARLRELCDSVVIMQLRNQLTAKELLEVASLLAELEDSDRASIWYEQTLKLAPGLAEARAGILALQSRTSNTLSQLIGAGPPARSVSLAVKKNWPTKPSDPTVPLKQGSIRFRDDQATSGLDFSYFNGESGFHYLIEAMGGGVGAIDFDLDGWPDLFFPQGNEILREASQLANPPADQLFRNRGGTGFSAVPVQAGIADSSYGQGVAVGDFDNDGFDDLLVANFGQSTLLQNQGDGTFLNVTQRAGLTRQEMSTSAGWGDFDQDGLLDLFVVNYVDGLKVCHNDRGEISVCSPSNHLGVDDRVFRNCGDGVFEDVSASIGLAAGGKGLGLLLADLDDDGQIDAFVANDTTPNFFYRNRSTPGTIRFSEEGLISGLALGETGNAQAGMGIACGDLNGDLRPDLYVTYFHREANGLYLNQGGGVFLDATRSSDLYHPTINLLGFGAQGVDFDLDGSLELIVTNGHIDQQQAFGVPWKMPPQLFVATSGGRYVERSSDAGEFFQGEYLGRGLIRLDWNRDGQPDVVIVHQDRPVALLTNVTEKPGHFLELDLRATRGNRSAIGTRVHVTSGGRTQRADITSGDGFYCSNERKLIFGTGSATEIDRVEIHWTDGSVDVHEHLAASSRWRVIQGGKPIAANPEPSQP